MTRRSLFSLLGLSWLPGIEPENLLRGTITIPSDGDVAIAEEVRSALVDLRENSAWMSTESVLWLGEDGKWGKWTAVGTPARVNA